jgi:hypothetical protein
MGILSSKMGYWILASLLIIIALDVYIIIVIVKTITDKENKTVESILRKTV